MSTWFSPGCSGISTATKPYSKWLWHLFHYTAITSDISKHPVQTLEGDELRTNLISCMYVWNKIKLIIFRGHCAGHGDYFIKVIFSAGSICGLLKITIRVKSKVLTPFSLWTPLIHAPCGVQKNLNSCCLTR